MLNGAPLSNSNLDKGDLGERNNYIKNAKQRLHNLNEKDRLTQEESEERKLLYDAFHTEDSCYEEQPPCPVGALVCFLKRFIAYPNEHTQLAHALWIIHTHLIDCFESTPRLAALSTEPASGKTRLLEITEMLVPNPVEAVNVTPAYLFRKVADEEGKPTILYDEIDTVFGPKAKNNEEIRGLLNAGHRKGAVAGRCITVGGQIRTEEISAYSAVALAGIGNLPDTILSRAIVIRMRRRAHTEEVEQFRGRLHKPEGDELRNKISAWCAHIADEVIDTFPCLPHEITDRNADLWEPLLAIAQLAGDEWLDKALVSAVSLVTESQGSTPSLGIRLLSDVRKLFEHSESMFTEEILESLNNNDELPWGDLYGKSLTPRKLGSMLRKYSIQSPTTIRINNRTLKGYKREWFYDAWERNLPTTASPKPVTSDTSATKCPKCDNEGCNWCEQIR